MEYTASFSGFSVDDLDAARQFYGETLGIKITEDMGLNLQLKGGEVFIYPKQDHQPASFTVLNFVVPDITAAVTELKAKGISFENYHSDQMPQDDNDILRGKSVNRGPDIAWFKDPAGNILSVIEH